MLILLGLQIFKVANQLITNSTNENLGLSSFPMFGNNMEKNKLIIGLESKIVYKNNTNQIYSQRNPERNPDFHNNYNDLSKRYGFVQPLSKTNHSLPYGRVIRNYPKPNHSLSFSREIRNYSKPNPSLPFGHVIRNYSNPNHSLPSGREIINYSKPKTISNPYSYSDSPQYKSHNDYIIRNSENSDKSKKIPAINLNQNSNQFKQTIDPTIDRTPHQSDNYYPNYNNNNYNNSEENRGEGQEDNNGLNEENQEIDYREAEDPDNQNPIEGYDIDQEDDEEDNIPEYIYREEDTPDCAAGHYYCVQDYNYPEFYLRKAIDNQMGILTHLMPESTETFDLVEGIPKEKDENYTYIESGSESDLYNSEGSEPNQHNYREGGYICPSYVSYIQPKRALNNLGLWKIILNLHESYRGVDYIQHIRVEECMYENTKCSYSPHYYTTECVQKYSNERLLAWTPDKGIHLDVFRLPIACSCHLKANTEL